MHPRFFFLLLLAPLFCISMTHAAQVTKVSGKQVLIDNEGSDIQPGSRHYVTIDGKKRGIVQITKSSKGKSLGRITKGRAAVGASVEPAGGGSKSADADGDLPAPRKGKQKSTGGGPGNFIGVIAGYSMDSQSVKTETEGTVAMSGSGYSLKGFFDMPLSGGLGMIARSGVEQLNWSSGSKSTSIMYFSVDGLLRYSFGESGFVPYIGGGGGIHYPFSKSSNILLESRISTTTVFFANGGFTYPMSDTMILTGVAEYAFFPPSNDVSTSFMTVRFGAGWRY